MEMTGFGFVDLFIFIYLNTISVLLQEKEVLGEMELRQIRNVKNRQRRCETFLDIIETKESLAYEAFLEAVSKLHPNIYLILTGNKDEEDEDLLAGHFYIYFQLLVGQIFS